MGAGAAARAPRMRANPLIVALRFLALVVTVFATPLVLLAVADALLRDNRTATRVECRTCDPLTTLTAPPATTAAPVDPAASTVPGETVPGETVPGETVPGGAQDVVAPTTTTIPPTPVAAFVGQPVTRRGSAVRFELADLESGEWTDRDDLDATGVGLAPWRQYHVEVVVPAGETRPVIGDLETRGLVMPAGFGSLGVLPSYDALALVAAPLLVASVVFLFVENRRRTRREAVYGTAVTLVRRPVRRRDRPRPVEPATR